MATTPQQIMEAFLRIPVRIGKGGQAFVLGERGPVNVAYITHVIQDDHGQLWAWVLDRSAVRLMPPQSPPDGRTTDV